MTSNIEIPDVLQPYSDGIRVHHEYGEHRGILVTVVMVTVTVSNFSTPLILCTLTRGVQVYHGALDYATRCWQ